jgi:hypothetical protein
MKNIPNFDIFTLYGIYKRCGCRCRCKEHLPKNWRAHLLLKVHASKPKNRCFGKLQERFYNCGKGFTTEKNWERLKDPGKVLK